MNLHKVYGVPDTGLSALEVDGRLRVLGCLPSPEPDDIPPLASSHDLSAAEPRECSLRWLSQPVLDQGQSSACNPHACVVAAQRTWALSGQPARRFSPWPLYALINNGRDAGSSLEDGVKAMRDAGLFPAGLAPDRLLWKQDIPQSAYPVARRYRVHDVLWARTFRELILGLSLGFVGVAGIPVGRNFSNLDRDGAVPPPDSIVGYHAVEVNGARYSAQTGRWLATFQNSWSASWGDGGFSAFSEASTTGPYFRAFLLRVLADDPSDAASDPLPVPPLSGNEDASPDD